MKCLTFMSLTVLFIKIVVKTYVYLNDMGEDSKMFEITPSNILKIRSFATKISEDVF
jgi:hypothetical protein